MHYLYQVNRLKCDTGAQKNQLFLAELVILQPQRLLKRKNIVG
jgi:hypothetical protein